MTSLRSLLTGMLALAALAASAQQNIGFKATSVKSPVVAPDRTVTFRLNAPMAHTVKVGGDWTGSYTEAEMTLGPDSIWSYTTAAVRPELYTYRYIVDGVGMLDPVNPFVRRDVGNVFSIFFVDGPGASDYMVHDVPHGTVQQVWYDSPSLSGPRRMQVYLPAGYESSDRRYPVLYLLHGSGGDENAWTELGCTPRILDNLIARGEAEPMIVVMPNGNPSKQAAPGETADNLKYLPCMSNEMTGYKDGQYEMAFPEIVAYTDTTFRTIADKAHRAIAGLSMGGGHSMCISANYPDMFDYVGLFSPGVLADRDKGAYGNIYDKIARQKGLRLYWIGIGETDFLYDTVTDFRHGLDAIGFPYTYHESPGGHMWQNWRQYMLMFVPRLFR